MLKHTAEITDYRHMPITIMQTYDLWLKISAIALFYRPTLLKIHPYNTTWTGPDKHEWSNKKGQQTEQRTANVQM